MTDQVLGTTIQEFNNSKLRESIAAALAGVPPSHGNAVLDVSNKGAGVMLVQRFGDSWAVVLAGRYSRDEKDRNVQVAVQKSW